MNLDTAFTKALGRMPTSEERDRLRRLRDAFEIRDNDALWALVGVHEFYNVLLRQYPDKCFEAVSKAMRGRLPSPPAGPRGPDDVARRELYWLTLVGLVIAYSALLGSLAMAVGNSLPSGQQPCWVAKTAAGSVAANLLGAPSGWIVLLVLLVPALYAAAWGWARGRDAGKTWRERSKGWSTLAAVGLSLVSWLLLLSAL